MILDILFTAASNFFAAIISLFPNAEGVFAYPDKVRWFIAYLVTLAGQWGNVFRFETMLEAGVVCFVVIMRKHIWHVALFIWSKVPLVGK